MHVKTLGLYFLGENNKKRTIVQLGISRSNIIITAAYLLLFIEKQTESLNIFAIILLTG